jgi:multicomponent Na+:H+ antiporter subunit E
MSRLANIRILQLGAGAAALAAIYALVLSSFDPWDLATGFGLGLAILLGFRRFLLVDSPLPAGTVLRRTLAFVPFALAVVYEITVGTWTVALIVLGLRPLRQPGIVEVPIGPRSPIGVAVTGLAITLSPGSFLVDIDWEEAVLLIHVIDASDPAAVIANIQRFYTRYQRQVFP